MYKYAELEAPAPDGAHVASFREIHTLQHSYPHTYTLVHTRNTMGAKRAPSS